MAAIKFHPMIAPILAILLFLLPLVDAGHFRWEPRQPRHAIGKANYVHFNTRTWPHARWPDSEIRYCWNNDEAKNRLKRPLEDAIRVWGAAGLPDHFRFSELERKMCDEFPDMTLLIEYNDELNFVTAVANTAPRPKMLLGVHADVDLNIGTVAHELGHAWGLLHLHQDPRFWDVPDQGPFIFHCENLVGFHEMMEGLSQDEIWGPEGLCKDWGKASSEHWGAMFFLPMPAYLAYSDRPWFAGDHDVDWKSLMLYDSRAGGRDYENPVLVRRRDKSTWTQARVPSSEDVRGVVNLYHGAVQPDPTELLIYFPSSPWNSNFRSKLPDCKGRNH